MTRALGWSLVHFVWQGAAIASLVAGLNLGLRRSSPQARYLLACLALLAMLAAPLVTFRALVAGDPAAAQLPAAAPSGPSLPTVSASPALAAPPAPAREFWRGVEPLLPALVIAWAAGVVVLGARALGGLALVMRLRRAGLRESPASLAAVFARLADRIGVRRAVRLYESALVSVPTVVGVLRPAVLVPASALTGLTAQQLELILAHELAHVRRHDYLVNLLQSAAETLLFYHPATWWVSQRIRVEREHCCDDVAVAVCGSPVRYARALVELEGLCGDAPALTVAASGGSLLDRIARLVGRAAEPSPAARGFGATLMAGSVALAVAAGSILVDRPAAATAYEPPSAPGPSEAAALSSPQSEQREGGNPAKPEAPGTRRDRAPKPAPERGGPQARAFPLERVLEMARAGITPEFVDEMDELGYRDASAAELIALRHQGVSPGYVRELAALGYKDLALEELIGLRSQGVSADFAKGLAAQGLANLSLQNLLALRAQGVTPQYVAELREAGLSGLSVTGVMALRSQGVTGRYASELKALGYASLSQADFIALRSQGVSAEYVRELGELGYTGLDQKLLVGLRAQGVTPEYVRELREQGYSGLSVDQLIALRSHGVTPEYVRELGEAGFEKLSPEELVQLRSQGVSAQYLKRLRSRS
jgi:beta-lactamase regulating signal transducer with metallopeptidase domain